MTHPHTQPDSGGYNEAEGYAASLRQQAKWVRECKLDGTIDADELDAAADFIARATSAQPAGLREALATALARRLCQLFDSGGESQRSVRARHASAIFQLLNRDAPEYLAEQRWCDASPISYLERGEAMALTLPAERPAVVQGGIGSESKTGRRETKFNPSPD